MKIAEETGDGDMKEQAKVNFGMANASMKWTNHVTNILQNLQSDEPREEEEDFEEGEGEDFKLPEIKGK
jgi:hypothetical protein